MTLDTVTIRHQGLPWLTNMKSYSRDLALTTITTRSSNKKRLITGREIHSPTIPSICNSRQRKNKTKMQNIDECMTEDEKCRVISTHSVIAIAFSWLCSCKDEEPIPSQLHPDQLFLIGLWKLRMARQTCELNRRRRYEETYLSTSINNDEVFRWYGNQE